MSEALRDRFEVEVDGEQYVFRIPSISFDISVGYKSAEIRRRAYPEGQGLLGAVDFSAVQFSRSCAYLELYLIQSTALWPYGISDDVKPDYTVPPKVDFEKFPVWAADMVMEVGAAFEQRYADFRRPRDRGNRQSGEQAVAGKQDSGAP